MRTPEGPFPMETTYTWEPVSADKTRMTLRNRGEPCGFSRLMAPFMALAMHRVRTVRTSRASRDFWRTRRLLTSLRTGALTLTGAATKDGEAHGITNFGLHHQGAITGDVA